MNYIGKILPVDGYYVLLKGNLAIDYTKSLTHLYQPLIGMQAVILYQTLLHEIELQSNEEPQTHHTLMNYLNIPLDAIYQARLRLEGIGLLKTYQTDKNKYTYILQSPFSPQEFFSDGMLSELLYHHVGEMKFSHLKRHYARCHMHDYGKNITVSFEDVYQTFYPSFESKKPIADNQIEQSPRISNIDFTWIEQMLKQRMIPVKKILTKSNRKLISQMRLLYDLATHEIEKAILWALTDENILDPEEFKAACQDLFKTQQNNTKIQLTDKVSNPNQPTNLKAATKEEQLIYELETISPKQLLEDLSSGNHASIQDMRAIQEVMTTQGLPAPVMNVLIHYVLLQSNMKLSKAYLEKIASHWSRANLKSAKEAMAFAKRETERYQKYSKTNKFRNTKSKSNEVIPDWFKERKKKEKETSKRNEKTNQQAVNEEKEKEELMELLRKHSSNKQNNHLQG